MSHIKNKSYKHVESKVKLQILQIKQQENERRLRTLKEENEKKIRHEFHFKDNETASALVPEIDGVKPEQNGLHSEINAVKSENTQLQNELHNVIKKFDLAFERNSQLEDQITQLKEEISKQSEDISKLSEEVSARDMKIMFLQSELNDISKRQLLSAIDVDLVSEDVTDMSSVCSKDFSMAHLQVGKEDSVFLKSYEPILLNEANRLTPKRKSKPKSILTKFRKTSRKVLRKFSCNDGEATAGGDTALNMLPLYKPMLTPKLRRTFTFTSGIGSANISTPGRYNLERKIFASSGKKKVLFSNLTKSAEARKNRRGLRVESIQNNEQRSADIKEMVGNLNEVSDYLKTLI